MSIYVIYLMMIIFTIAISKFFVKLWLIFPLFLFSFFSFFFTIVILDLFLHYWFSKVFKIKEEDINSLIQTRKLLITRQSSTASGDCVVKSCSCSPARLHKITQPQVSGEESQTLHYGSLGRKTARGLKRDVEVVGEGEKKSTGWFG